MAKIGLLGGTFNPIHNGHLMLAEGAYRHLTLDKVLIMPSGLSYFKLEENVLPKHIRAEMVKLAIKDYPYFEFSDIEINKEGNTYTYETLEDIRKIYPNDEIYFLIGADTLYSIEKWKYPERILNNCILAIMNRDDSEISDINTQCSYLTEKHKAVTVILNVDKIDISSTDIRTAICNNLFSNVNNVLPEKVYEYIVKNNLYK